MLEPAWDFAKTQFILSDAKNDRCADVAPTARATAQIHSAAVGDEARFYFCIRGAENEGIIMKIGINVPKRGQQRLEEFVTCAIRLAHRGIAPEIIFGGNGLV